MSDPGPMRDKKGQKDKRKEWTLEEYVRNEKRATI